MWSPYILGGLVLGFLLIFWTSPIGVPALRRIGEGQLPPDLQWGSRTDDTFKLVGIYGERGLAHWRRLLLLDMLFPALYGAFLVELLERWGLWAHASAGWVMLSVSTAIAAVVADYAENVLLLWVIAALPRQLRSVVGMAAGFTRIKFLALGLVVLTPLLQALLGGAGVTQVGGNA